MPELDEMIGLQQVGKSRSEILAAMKAHGFTIAEAIKGSMQLFGIGLGDAKSLVTSDPSWIPTAQAAVPFQDELVRLVQSDQELSPAPSVVGVAHDPGVAGGSRRAL